jgi:hypothetical protein
MKTHLASGVLRAHAWPCRQCRSGTTNPVDALRNPAARSGNLCGCGGNAAGDGGAGMPRSGVEGIADRSNAGIANRMKRVRGDRFHRIEEHHGM